MSKKIKYTDEPMQIGERMADFLPPPEDLVKKSEKVTVTLDLTSDTINLFKKQAEQLRVPYQKMLCGIIDNYAREHT